MSADEAMSLGLVDGVWTAKHEQAVNALAQKKMKSGHQDGATERFPAHARGSRRTR